MRIKFTYRAGHGNTPPVAEISNADTGERLELVQNVQFSLNAFDMQPHLILEIIPDEVEIEGAAEMVRIHRQAGPRPSDAPQMIT